MIICIKRPGSTKLVEVNEVEFEPVTGTVTFMHKDWDESHYAYTKGKSDQTVMVFDGGELIMRVDENGAKMLKGNIVPAGAD
jgi:hypothetical protein